MGDANRVQVSYVQETSFGVAETASNLQILRLNNESLVHDKATTVSEEMRADRQISDIARIGVSTSGDIAFELSYGTYDDFIQASLLSSGWSAEAKITSANTLSAAAGDNSLNDSASGFGSFAANRWVLVSGFTIAANNGFKKIFSATAAKLIFVNGTMSTEAAGEPITVQMGGQIANGTTLVSYNIERDYQDATPAALSLFLGQSINAMNLEIPVDGIITGTFGFMGSEETSLTSSSGTGYDAIGTTVIMTGANHVPDFMENYEDQGIISLSMSLTNNLRTRMQVGTLGVVSIGTGTVEITGTFSVYFSTVELYNKFLAHTDTSLVLGVKDSQGSGYIIELPAVKITTGTRSAGGINTDVIGEFGFSAKVSATEQTTIKIARFPVMENFAGVVQAVSTSTAALTVT